MSEPFPIQDLLNTTISVYTNNAITLPNGDITNDVVIKYANEPATFQPISGDKDLQYGKLYAEATHQFIGLNELIIVNGDILEDAKGDTYDILYWEFVDSALGYYMSIFVKRMINVS